MKQQVPTVPKAIESVLSNLDKSRQLPGTPDDAYCRVVKTVGEP